MNKKFKKLSYILSTLMLVMFTVILFITGIFQHCERALNDVRLSFNRDESINTNIIRLYMDDLENYKLDNYKSYTKLSNGKLSKNELAKLIDYVEKNDPALIILDFNLNNVENTTSSNISTPEKNLSKTVKKYNNILLSTRLSKLPLDEEDVSEYSNVEKTNALLDVLVEDESFDSENTYFFNESLPLLFTENEFLTVSNIENNDKKVSEAKPIYKLANRETYLPSSAFYAFLKLKNKTNSRLVIKDKKLSIDKFVIRLNDSYNIYLNLKNKKLYYPSYPMGAILKSVYENKKYFAFGDKEESSSIFKDKIVIFEEEPANVAIKNLPNGEKYTNAEIIALELDNYLAYFKNPVLKNQFPVNASIAIEIVLSAIFCLFVIFSKIKTKTNYMGFIFAFVYVLIAVVYYLQTKILLAVAVPLYCMLVLAVMNMFLDNFLKNNQQDVLKSTYRQHLSKEMLNKLTKNINKVSLKPQNHYITVLYCRVEDFTQLTKNVNSQVLINSLNEVLDVLVTSSLKNNGTVNKINSSSLMIYFGAPFSDMNKGNDAQNAAKAAFDIWNKMGELNQKYDKNYHFTFDLKISLHSGDALVGEIGSNNFGSYGAFGDTIDIVRQISKISSQFNKSLLISQTTYELLKEKNITSLTNRDIELTYAGAITTKVESQQKLSLYEIRSLYSGEDE